MSTSELECDLFPRGSAISGENFSGKAWLYMMVVDQAFNCPVGNVTFQPGARNSWHKHPGGQILLVTGGVGYYQERGKAARKLRKGDVVSIPPDVEHWHGAGPDTWFAHVFISTNVDKGQVLWLEPVSDADYARATE